MGKGRYGRVLRRPGIAVVLLPYLVARVASAMVLLALLLHVQRQSDSFLTAGLVTASFALAVAVASPVLGRLVDTRGQTPVLVSCGLVHPIALAFVVWATRTPDVAPSAQGIVLLGAAAAGATLPPMAACMRALWPSLLDDEELKPTAFTIESLVVEACELIGPLMVGALVALMAPDAAVLVAAGLSAAGTLLFAAGPASRHGVIERRQNRTRLRSPLAVPGVRRMVLVVGASVAAVSALEVSIAAFAGERGDSGVAGWLIGAWVAGSLLSGWFYGSRSWSTPAPIQLAGLLLAGAVVGLAPLLASGAWSMAGLLAVAGLCLSPATAVQFTVLSELAPDRRRAESFTWASTAAFLGIAAGNLAAGPTVQSAGWEAGVLLASAFGLLASLLAWRGRFALGLLRLVEPSVPVELYEKVLADLDEAVMSARVYGARNDELARQIAVLRMDARDSSGPAPDGELVLEVAEGRVEHFIADGLVRLDRALADLRTMEERRRAVLAELDRLRSALAAEPLPTATVTVIPRQVSGG